MIGTKFHLKEFERVVPGCFSGQFLLQIQVTFWPENNLKNNNQLIYTQSHIPISKLYTSLKHSGESQPPNI